MLIRNGNNGWGTNKWQIKGKIPKEAEKLKIELKIKDKMVKKSIKQLTLPRDVEHLIVFAGMETIKKQVKAKKR